MVVGIQATNVEIGIYSMFILQFPQKISGKDICQTVGRIVFLENEKGKKLGLCQFAWCFAFVRESINKVKKGIPSTAVKTRIFVSSIFFSDI